MPHSVLTEPAETQGLRHAPVTIALHWITALLVVLLWTIGQTIDFVPNGALRVDYRSVHVVLGATLALVVVARLIWRATRGGMLPPLDQGWLLWIARVAHWALYVLLIATVVFGINYAWAEGVSIFNLFRIPQMIPGDRVLAKQIGGWHALAANTVVIVAGLHAVAALVHHYVFRDATLRRMLPWRQ
jgi:cytochrome b561